MNWFQVGQGDAVGWTSEGTPAEGYYLGSVAGPLARGIPPVSAKPTMQPVWPWAWRCQWVMARGNVSGRSRASPRRGRLAGAGASRDNRRGPTCADGWIWWQIANSMGRTLGWTSEGDEKGYWLFALTSKAAAPKLAGTYKPSADNTLVVNFNSDYEAANVIFDSLGAAAASQPKPYATSTRRTLQLPDHRRQPRGGRQCIHRGHNRLRGGRSSHRLRHGRRPTLQGHM